MADSKPPPRPVTPYAPFEERPRSMTPPSVYAVRESSPPASARPSTFTQAIQDELARIEQSITENVKRALQALGTIVIRKQDETKRAVDAAQARLDSHADELRTLRGALEERTGLIRPPPPDNL